MTTPYAWQNLLDSIESAWPASRYRDVGLVVGCSGGADSVALLRCLSEMVGRDAAQTQPRGFMVVAHFNHRLRGTRSDGDADFVQQLAEELGVEFEFRCGDGSQRDEESARDQRRSFFCDVLRRRGARYLALGHSLDDNVETVLHRLVRGTGPAGIAGIAPFRPLADHPDGRDFVVARPMLAVRRDQIRDALRSRGGSWREDESNHSLEYHRNWIRSELIPLIQTEFPEAVPAIGRAIEGQRQWRQTLQGEIDRWLELMLVQRAPLLLRRIDRFETVGDPYRNGPLVCSQAVTVEALRRCWHESGWPLQAMGQVQWNRIFEMLSGRGADTIMLPGSIEVRRDDQSITLYRCP